MKNFFLGATSVALLILTYRYIKKKKEASFKNGWKQVLSGIVISLCANLIWSIGCKIFS